MDFKNIKMGDIVRFKTKEEFIEEFGSSWREYITCGWGGHMNSLFGFSFVVENQELLLNLQRNNMFSSNRIPELKVVYHSSCTISNDMLTLEESSNFNENFIADMNNLRKKYPLYALFLLKNGDYNNYKNRLNIVQHEMSKKFIIFNLTDILYFLNKDLAKDYIDIIKKYGTSVKSLEIIAISASSIKDSWFQRSEEFDGF